jgi:hypothetical protein
VGTQVEQAAACAPAVLTVPLCLPFSFSSSTPYHMPSLNEVVPMYLHHVGEPWGVWGTSRLTVEYAPANVCALVRPHRMTARHAPTHPRHLTG